MDLVRYKPGEAIRWLESGAADMRKSAKRTGTRALAKTTEGTDIPGGLRDAAGAIYGFGKSALADLLHKQLEASEYVFYEDRLEVITTTGTRYIPFREIQAMKVKGDRCILLLDRGKLTIKPHAYILSGNLKVPVGWTRNGLEVAFEMLPDELSARAGVNIEYL